MINPNQEQDLDQKIIIRLKDAGKDNDNTPFTIRFNLAKLIKENKLSVSRIGSYYFLVIDSYEIGFPLKALKEIIGLALSLIPEEHGAQVIREWYERSYF